jgi:hypothetical protein
VQNTSAPAGHISVSHIGPRPLMAAANATKNTKSIPTRLTSPPGPRSSVSMTLFTTPVNESAIFASAPELSPGNRLTAFYGATPGIKRCQEHPECKAADYARHGSDEE